MGSPSLCSNLCLASCLSVIRSYPQNSQRLLLLDATSFNCSCSLFSLKVVPCFFIKTSHISLIRKSSDFSLSLNFSAMSSIWCAGWVVLISLLPAVLENLFSFSPHLGGLGSIRPKCNYPQMSHCRYFYQNFPFSFSARCLHRLSFGNGYPTQISQTILRPGCREPLEFFNNGASC